MEYVDGELLRDRLRRERRLPIETAVALASPSPTRSLPARPRRSSTATSSPRTSWSTRTARVKLVDFGIALDTTLRKMTWAGLSQTVGTRTTWRRSR